MFSGVLLTLLVIATSTAHACDFTVAKRDLNCGSERWGYLSTNGPQTWSKINSACGFGDTFVGHQTPIHVGPEVPREKEEQESHHTSRKLALPRGGYEVWNNGHTIVASSNTSASTAEGPSGIEAFGEVWLFEQFHLHTPAEHTLSKGEGGGRDSPWERPPMEVHFVHKSPKNSSALAVIGMFFEFVDATNTTATTTTTSNKFVETLYSVLPTVSSCGFTTVVQELGKILADEVTPIFTDAGADIATYHGSLTTPPCSEVVRWFVVTNRRIPITKDQAQRFHAVLGNNARCTANEYAEVGWKNVPAACERPVG